VKTYVKVLCLFVVTSAATSAHEVILVGVVRLT
jgi:hypothetical protein